MKYYSTILLFFTCVSTACSTSLQNGNVTLNYNITSNDGIFLNLVQNGIIKLSGHIGVGIQLQPSKNSRIFVSADNDVTFSINDAIEGFNIYWESFNTSRVFQDCFDFQDFDWFAGKEGNPTEWHVQKSTIKNSAYIVSPGSSISEPYWLSSIGSFLFVNETTPLFVDQNNLVNNSLCLIGKIEEPYAARTKVILNYTIAANDNATEAHQNAIDNFLHRPADRPDIGMIRYPTWSTSIKYADDLSDQLLSDFAQSIKNNNIRGQVQIEDGWEECRGSLTFKKLKLAAINNTISKIHNFALNATLLIHPFVDVDCGNVAQTGLDKGYFVKGSNGKEIRTSYWNNSASYLVDFTNPEAKNWFQERVGLLIKKHKLDGFKFDAGEASWATARAVLQGTSERGPNELTEIYNSFSNFTESVQVHSGWRTQWVPVFVSIPEKESDWTLENGLKSVLVNMFQLNIAGYTMAIPGLIGGKSLERPSPELYVRWTQAVTFMPVMQFGYLPWEIIGSSFDVLTIVKKFIDLHDWYTDGIYNMIKNSQYRGHPVIAPIWWVDSENPEAFKITDQYMLGQNIMIAPVLEEGAIARDIYLPPGRWSDQNNDIYEGSSTLKDYPAPIDVLPYFMRVRE